MKLRYIREQKEQMKREMQNTNITRKKNKFNLGDESDDADFNFLTHKGKKIEDLDDFKDKISDEQYKALKPKVDKALPTMAISAIKFDEDGNTKRAKYCIVVLGTLDPNKWNKKRYIRTSSQSSRVKNIPYFSNSL